MDDFEPASKKTDAPGATTAAPKPSSSPILPAHAALLPPLADYLRINRGLSRATTTAYTRHVAEFLAYLAGQGLHDLSAVTPATIETYVRHIYFERHNRRAQTRASKLSALRVFFRRLLDTGAIAADPTASIPTPRIPVKLPVKFSDAQLRDLFRAPDPDTLDGLRDLALMMTLYTTGARSAELLSLDVSSVRYTQDGARVLLLGKGSKERIIAIRGLAVRILRRLTVGRPSSDPLFISLSRAAYGRRLSKSGLDLILKKYAAIVGIADAEVFAHKFRATFATNLHEDGHDIVEISTRMGHANIETTRRYIAISDRSILKTAISGNRLRRLMGDDEKI